MIKNDTKYNLENRTIEFSKNIIGFSRSIKRDVISNPLIGQLIRAATSIGANYCEANGASSKKDFKNKIYLCKKEARETKYWLQIIAETDTASKEKCRKLWKECQELTLIFSKIILTLEKKEKSKF